MLSPELKSKIEQYVGSAITLDQLEDWIVPRLRNFLRNPSTADAHTVSVVELGLAEISAGIKSEDDFRDDLRNLMPSPVTELTFNVPEPDTISSSSIGTIKFQDVGLPRTSVTIYG